MERRILVCLDSLAAGGAERQTVELVRRLDRSRFSVRVLSLHGPRMGQSRHFVPTLAEAGVPVLELDRRWSAAELPGSLLAVCRDIRSFRPHLVHSVSHHSNHLIRFARVLCGHRFQLLTAIRTEYDPRQLRNERLEHRLSSFVVCNSPSMAAKLRDSAGIPEARLRYIPNGIDTSRFASASDPTLRSRLSPSASRIGVMLARITQQKSQDLLARAIGRLVDKGVVQEGQEFWLVGERESEEVQGRLDSAIRSHRLERFVRLFPATAEPAAFLQASDYSILASLWEGTPNAVLESLAAGRPALVSEGANASGLIRPGVEGWSVLTGDEEALATGLARILELPLTDLRSMAPACIRRASEFDMSTMVRRYEDLYASLIDPR